jgi:hypothetical protein
VLDGNNKPGAAVAAAGAGMPKAGAGLWGVPTGADEKEKAPADDAGAAGASDGDGVAGVPNKDVDPVPVGGVVVVAVAGVLNTETVFSPHVTWWTMLELVSLLVDFYYLIADCWLLIAYYSFLILAVLECTRRVWLIDWLIDKVCR